MAADTSHLRLLINPQAGSAGDTDELESLCRSMPSSGVCQTTSATHVADQAAQAAKEGITTLGVAGGDGTISLAVSGLMRARDAGVEIMPSLLIVPLGTGNDLSRALDLPLEPMEAVKLHETGRLRSLDVIRWRLDGGHGIESGYAVNVIAGGFSSKLQKSLTPKLKKRWGPLAYVRAAVETATELVPHTLHLRLDDGEPQEMTVLNVVVASARYAGGGISVAPKADPSDGQLDIVATTPGNLLELADVSARFMSGNVLKSDLTQHLIGKKIEVWAEPEMPFNVDGDWTGAGRLTAEIVPDALKVWVPSGDAADD